MRIGKKNLPNQLLTLAELFGYLQQAQFENKLWCRIQCCHNTQKILFWFGFQFQRTIVVSWRQLNGGQQWGEVRRLIVFKVEQVWNARFDESLIRRVPSIRKVQITALKQLPHLVFPGKLKGETVFSAQGRLQETVFHIAVVAHALPLNEVRNKQQHCG